MKPQRIILIGPGGAGKSTLARRIAECSGLPLIHLDALYWQAGWQATPSPEWRERISVLLAEPAWVMDGNFGGTLDQRLAACDTVILLDLPPWQCLWRVLRRRWRWRGQSRPDMAPGCPEKIDTEFLWWILSYRWRKRPAIQKKLQQHAALGKSVFVLRSQAAVEQWLEAVVHARSAV